MDKLDKSIKNAKQTYEPREDFVAVTMQRITGTKRKSRLGLKFWVPMLAGSLAVLILVFTALPNSGRNSSKSGGGVSQTSTPSQTASTTPSGTGNTDLTNDLNAIDGQMNQEKSDQNNANSALNDSSQEITVPTD